MQYGAVLVWLLAYLGLGALALPATAALFRRLPARGAGLAIPAALAALALVGYWVGQVAFGLVAALAGVGVLAAASGVARVRGARVDRRRFLEAGAVFAAAFLLLVAVRAVDPGAFPGGGEKFLDFGLLASLLRADVLPPEDPWFAGEPVQYYYGGHMLAALLARLTFTKAAYAYNLALAGFYATYVAAAYGLAGAVAAGRGRSYRVGGLAGAFLVGVASNLATPIRLLAWALPWKAGERLAALAGLEMKGVAHGPAEFNYWFASRVVDAAVVNGDQWHYIDEFPFFAFLNGDMHGHMMSPPFLLLAAAVCYAYWRTPAEASARRGLLVLGGLPPLAGLLALVNTWSFPVVPGLALLALLFAPAPPWTLLPGRVGDAAGAWAARSRLRTEAARVALAGAFAVAVAALGLLVVVPFVTGPASGRALGLFPEPRSDLPGLVVVHGVFLAVSAAFLARRFDRPGRRWGRVAVGLLAVLFVTWLFDAPAVGLFVPLLAGAWYLLRTRSDAGFESVLLVAVCGLLVLVEFAYVVEQAGPGRSNTVFKVYAQVWALWSVGAGAMLADLIDVSGLVGALAGDAAGVRERVGRLRRPGHLRTALLLVLLLSSALYAGFGLAWQFENGRQGATLDARQFVRDHHPDEAAAIEWLATEVSGQPNMASAPGRAIYQWVNGPSSLTGVPTVAGWAHEIGYRGREAYTDRARDVRLLFTGDPDTRATMLRKYDVRYVYVGPVERSRYGADLEFADEPGISVAHRSGNVTIYAVDRSALTT